VVFSGRGSRAGSAGAGIGIAAVFLAAAAVRAVVDLGSPLVPKINGAYYLVQVRALLEHGRLAFPDLPLVFLLEAGLARIAMALGASVNQAIIVSVKLVDILFPPLVALPAFLLARRIAGQSEDKREASLPVLAIALWSVLSLSPVLMTGDFQKNALGMAWFFCAALALAASLRGRAVAGLLSTIGFLFLAGMTHAGAFGAGLLFAIAAIAAGVVMAPPAWRRAASIGIAAGIGLLIALTAAWLVLDPARLARLLSIAATPLALFRHPWIFAAARGEIAASPASIANLAFVNAAAFTGIALLILRWRRLGPGIKVPVIAAISTTILLASPFAGSAWAERLHMMAYAPAAVLLAFAAPARSGRLRLLFPAVITFAALLLSLPEVPRLRQPSIPPESRAELEGLWDIIPDPDRSLVIARHGLEWWAAWLLRAKVSQEFGVEPSAWREYAAVYYLVMHPPPPGDGRGFGRPGLPGPSPFPEVRIPAGASILHEGRFFTLARADDPPPEYPLPRPD